MKFCIKCQHLLPATAFQRRDRSRDNLQGWCKACFNENNRRRRRKRVTTPHGLLGDKACSLCLVVKPLAEFHRRRRSRDGVQSLCKQCQIERVLATIDVKRARRTALALPGDRDAGGARLAASHIPARPRPPKTILGLEERRALSRKYCAAHRARKKALLALSVFTGDAIADMEAAKRLIGQYPDINLDSLMAIAAERPLPVCSRIAAIYVLGLSGAGRVYASLARIQGNPQESVEMRCHAAEALETLQATYATTNA